MLSKKEIEKWSNEQRVKALAKFIVLRSFDPNKALLYGYMLDGLLDEINEKQRKIEQLETREQKLIERIENEEICCLQKNNIIEGIIQKEAKRQVEAYKQHILKILKGEKE